MPDGYHGKILHVHLDDLSWDVETPSEEFYRKYMGGSALGMYYVLQHTPPGVGRLDPKNTLALTLSVVTGVAISGQSRLTATARSPLTGAIGDSQSGGFFPAEMKFAGFDGIIVYGKAEKPVYLWIKDGQVDLRPADHLWGKDTAEVETLIKDELDDQRVHILQTGIAGENQVRFAAMVSMANRTNGRTGMGAVMGSKNLKAIAVRGKMRPTVADKDGLNKLARWGAKNFPDSDIYTMGLYGTSEITDWQDETGGLPTRNWASGTFEGANALDGTTMSDTILKKRDTCYACTVKCKRVVEITAGDYKVDPVHGGPEYETVSTFGSYCGIDDLAAVSLANQYCNQYGMDTISCGATIAWAMDCFENGLLTEKDTGGLELRFGNAKAMTELVEMIAKREGLGDVLAEGSALAAQKLGVGLDLVVAVKGLELPAHMPEVKRSLSLIYAVNPFGADHQSHEHDPSYEDYSDKMKEIGLVDPQPADNLNQEKVHYALTTQYLYSLLDTLNICQFVFGPAWQLYGAEQLREMVALVTGWDVSVDEMLEVGARRLNMLRAYNAREGIGRDQDKLPPKLFQPRLGGATDGVALDEGEVEKAKDMYYEEAGWEVSTGMPKNDRLAELGLDWVAELL